VRDPKSGEAKGISVGIGKALAARLGVPFEMVEFAKLPDVVEAVREGRVDLMVTNATAARAQVMDFSGPLAEIDQGYLVMADSPFRTASDVDRDGVKVVAVQGSTTQATLPKLLRRATVVPAATIAEAKGMLARGAAEALATQKSILFELADDLPASRVLEGRYGLEQIAAGIPKGRVDGLPFLQAFVEASKADGSMARMIQDVGMRGTSVAPPR
jgi:polar amino acid transport system substrate-binding protein